MFFDKITCKVIYNHSPAGKCKIYDLDGCETNFLPDCQVIEEKWMPVCKQFQCTYDGIGDEKLSEEIALYVWKTVKGILQSTKCEEQDRMPAGAEFGIFIGIVVLLAILGVFLRLCFPVQFNHASQRLSSVLCQFRAIVSFLQRNKNATTPPPSYNEAWNPVQLGLVSQPPTETNFVSPNEATHQPSTFMDDYVIEMPPSYYNGVMMP